MPAPSKPPTPDEILDLDLEGMFDGWATLTTAQEEQFVESTLRGKWARVSGKVADVWKKPPAVIFEINRLGPKTRLNVRLDFDTADSAPLMLLNQGDAVRVLGEVIALGRNPFAVPHLHFAHCELLK